MFLVAMASNMNRSWRVDRPIVDAGNDSMALEYYFLPLVEQARQLGDPLLGARILGAAIEHGPSHMRTLSADNPPANVYQYSTAMEFSQAYEQCAGAYRAAGVYDRVTYYGELSARVARSVEVRKVRNSAENAKRIP